MPRKNELQCKPDIDCATHCKPERDNENRRKQQRLCLFAQVTETLTDEQMTSQRFNSKHIVCIVLIVNLRFNWVGFLANYNCTKSKDLNYSYNNTK